MVLKAHIQRGRLVADLRDSEHPDKKTPSHPETVSTAVVSASGLDATPADDGSVIAVRNDLVFHVRVLPTGVRHDSRRFAAPVLHGQPSE